MVSRDIQPARAAVLSSSDSEDERKYQDLCKGCQQLQDSLKQKAYDCTQGLYSACIAPQDKEDDRGACFLACYLSGALVEVVQSDGASARSVPIESVKCGDIILAVSDDGTVTQQPVIYVKDHSPAENDLIEITLESGKSVTPTHNHMVVVRISNVFKLKQASEVEVGDICCSINAEGQVVEDQVVGVNRYRAHSRCIYVIIPYGNMLVNGIVGTSRAVDDFSETLRATGQFVYRTLGTAAVIKFCRFGDWFSTTWLDRCLP